jgi:hypothetical protein
MSVNDLRAQLASQIREPEPTRAGMDRYLADCQARDERLDEEHRLLGIGRTAAVSMTHELVWEWGNATASRWWFALPERYMTPDSLRRPDWDHAHYPHDEHGHIGRRVVTRQRPETDEDRQIAHMVRDILADLDEEEQSS